MRRTIPLALVLLATLSPCLSPPDPSSTGAAWAADGTGNGNGNGNIGDGNGNGNLGSDNGNGNIGNGLGDGNATDGNGNGITDGGGAVIADPLEPPIGGGVTGVTAPAVRSGLSRAGAWHAWPGGHRHRHGGPAFDLDGRSIHGFGPGVVLR